MTRIAWVSADKIHVREPDGVSKTLSSKYAATVRERAVKIQKRHEWKRQGSGAMFSGLWQGTPADETVIYTAISSLTRGFEEAQVLYALDTESVVGVFELDLKTGEEKRLYHAADRKVRSLAASARNEKIAVSIAEKGGAQHLAVLDRGGAWIGELTEGDVVDTAPTWDPTRDGRLVYQSAGLGRDARGALVEVGPSAIVAVDLASGEMTTLLEDPKKDLCEPKFASDGTLYCLRRPRVERPRASPVRLAIDLILMPFRLLAGIFGYLAFFTMRYTGKPLITTGGAKAKTQDPRKVLEAENLAAANRAMMRDVPQEAKTNVPASWELVRLVNGNVEVVAKHVVAFDVNDKTIVHSDGVAIFEDGKRVERAESATALVATS